MGTTIHYKGSVDSKEKINEIIVLAEEFSSSMKWKTERYSKDSYSGIVIFPHEKSEAVSLIFDKNFKLSSYTKTVYAPEDIHNKIIKLLYTIKKCFKRLTVLDESGFWDEYVDSFKKSLNVTLSLPELNEDQINELSNGFIKKWDLNCVDEWFWKCDKSYGELNFPIIRDLMRKDLSHGRSELITIPEILKISDDRIKSFVSPDSPEITLIILAEAWLKAATENNLTPIKCSVFGWLISHGCFGFDGGYLNNFHRQSEKLFDKLIEETEDTLNPKVTLKILYALLDYFKVKRNVY